MQEGDDKRWIHFEDFSTKCEDQGSKYFMNETKQYILIEIDDHEESYISTRTRATNFTIIKIAQTILC